MEDGLGAYEVKDYATAHSQWMILAQDKTASGLWAQYYLGVLYEYGLGVPVDRAKARAFYEPTYIKVIRYIMHEEVVKKANEALPIDAVHRLAIFDVARSLEMEKSENKKDRRMASSVMQNARIALDVAGFYRHAESFYKVGLLELNGTGKNFLRNKKSAWAHFTLAAELGHQKAAERAAELFKKFNRYQKSEAQDILEDYRPYIRPPY
ncbi:hypothetical protein V5T82_02435 [Magnetovibrio sp. PR-2]|uniref:hypothetical protein n=1 Tax=Magnetovibrio sp. PR-2 TaxID=3120356 RepID=UPI002FCE0D70